MITPDVTGITKVSRMGFNVISIGMSDNEKKEQKFTPN